MDEKTKEQLIQYINRNFRTVLSYGNNGLVPVGEFIVTDIIEPEVDIEYSDFETIKRLARIVLSNVKDINVQIELPLEVFLNEYTDKARINSDLLEAGLSGNSTAKKIIDNVEKEILNDEDLQHLKDAKLISLEECDATYSDSTGIRSDNYSICPISFDYFIKEEKIREIETTKMEKIEEKKIKEEEKNRREEEKRKALIERLKKEAEEREESKEEIEIPLIICSMQEEGRER